MSATEDSRLPCRTSIKLEGAEWFIYNRNAAFDMLLDRLSRRDKAAARSASGSDSETNEKGAARILPPSNENHMKQGTAQWQLARRQSIESEFPCRSGCHRLVSRIAASRAQRYQRSNCNGKQVYTITDCSWLSLSRWNMRSGKSVSENHVRHAFPTDTASRNLV